jgi:replicative superfamily II helicase
LANQLRLTSLISNPFFINALKNLNPNYDIPSRKTLFGRLLDNEVAKVNNKVDEIIEFTNNITIGLDGWTAPDGSSIWNFIILTPSQEEYLYELGNYSDQSHTAEFLANQIESVINRIGSKKIIAIVSDNGANVVCARRLICSKYKKIMNIRCIAHCYNLISKDIILHSFAERMIQHANRIVQFFKKSHKAAAMLKEKIKQYEISGGGLKIYVKTR